MMTAAIEAVLKPMKERLEATIIPMQRTLESLQAEFVALRAEEKDGDAVMAADAKRMRMGSDRCDRVREMYWYNVFKLWGLLRVHFDSLAPPDRERCESWIAVCFRRLLLLRRAAFWEFAYLAS